MESGVNAPFSTLSLKKPFPGGGRDRHCRTNVSKCAVMVEGPKGCPDHDQERNALSAASRRNAKTAAKKPRFLQQEKRRGKMKKMVGSNL